MPPEGPELEAYKDMRKTFDTEWPSSAAMLTGSTPVEPIILEIGSKSEEGPFLGKEPEDMGHDSVQSLESECSSMWK